MDWVGVRIIIILSCCDRCGMCLIQHAYVVSFFAYVSFVVHMASYEDCLMKVSCRKLLVKK